jgi:hypothetical protein
MKAQKTIIDGTTREILIEKGDTLDEETFNRLCEIANDVDKRYENERLFLAFVCEDDEDTIIIG